MKKLTALFMVCIMAVCTASCSQKSGDEKSGDNVAQTEAETTISADAEKVLKDFAESSVSGEVDTMLRCMYPEVMIEGIESSGMKQEFAAAMSSGVGGTLKTFSTDSGKKLSDEAIKSAKQYFDAFAIGLQINGKNYQIKDGYGVNVNIGIEKDGETSEFTDPVTVVLIDGDGWKLIPASEDYLLNMTQQSTEQAELTTPEQEASQPASQE